MSRGVVTDPLPGPDTWLNAIVPHEYVRAWKARGWRVVSNLGLCRGGYSVLMERADD